MKYEPPCDCLGCREVDLLLTGVGEHQFTREERQDWPVPYGRGWRWVCACGSKGRWQCQSDNVAYHAWKRHAGLEVS